MTAARPPSKPWRVYGARGKCGATYTVPQGPDEYGTVERAHREHVADA